METTTEIIPLELLSGSLYFERYPLHVLGVPTEVSGPYGRVIAVIGDIAQELQKIECPTVSQFPYMPELAPAPDPEPNEADMESVLNQTKEVENTPVPTDGNFELVGFDEMRMRWVPEATDEDYRAWTWYQTGRCMDITVISQPGNFWRPYITPADQVATELQNWVQSGIMAFDGKEHVPSVIYYSGNLYEKTAALKANMEAVVQKYGQEVYDRQQQELENRRPEMLRIYVPKDERLYINPLDPFVKETKISTLANGTILDGDATLINGFEAYLATLGPDNYPSGSNYSDVYDYFITNNKEIRAGSRVTPQEADDRRKKAQDDAIALFQEFLYEGLSSEDQRRVEYQYNSRFNNFTEIEFKKIPIGFSVNRFFKSGPIDPRPALWEGVKFLSANGSGLIAYDVGVGKTMTAILAMAQALYTGQCKRPLVVVPNPTYAKWIMECIGKWDPDGSNPVNGVLPQYKDRVNDWYNLGAAHKNLPVEKPIRDQTITFLTYEGLKALGFSANAKRELGPEFTKVLTQGSSQEQPGFKPTPVPIPADTDDEESVDSMAPKIRTTLVTDIGKKGQKASRAAATLEEKIDAILGEQNVDTLYNFDELGFDYIVFDEAHNANHVFTQVEGRNASGGKDELNQYSKATGGSPSGLGLKLWMFCNMVQRRNSGGNTCLLSATPFTNSPLEIFSIVSMIAYDRLKQRGIESVIDFYDKFINLKKELVVTSRGSVDDRYVVKSFNNKIMLQSILYGNIIYKTGEEAGVPRPVKVVIPLTKDEQGRVLPQDRQVDCKLRPTPDQNYWMREIMLFANNESNAIEPQLSSSYWKPNKRGQLEILGRDLLAVNLAQACTLSPYLMIVKGKESNEHQLYDGDPITAVNLIESSPKLTYTMGCIKTIREHHLQHGEPISGVVIYMNRGKDIFNYVRQYLVEQLGYKQNEVEIIQGGIAQDKKERIKEAFLRGDVKVIIGSDAISEGIDLQAKSTVLFMLTLPWNPTDVKQIEGRIWRQGNQFSHVRIVNPLIENSVDVFMFQKLEEKTSRINDLWFRAGRNNVLSIDDFDPRELKMALITDPRQKAKADIKMQEFGLSRDLIVLSDKLKNLGDVQQKMEQFMNGRETIQRYYEQARPSLEQDVKTLEVKIAAQGFEKKETLERAERFVKTVGELLARPEDEKLMYAVIKKYARVQMNDKNMYSYPYERMLGAVDDQIKNSSGIESIEKTILIPAGYKIGDDLTPLIERLAQQQTDLNEKLKDLKSEANYNALVQQYEKELELSELQSKDMAFRISEFTKHNYLLSCLKDEHECDLQSAKIVARRRAPQSEPEKKPDPALRLRLAKAKAKALKIKLQLLAQDAA